MTDLDVVREWVGSSPDDDTILAKLVEASAANVDHPAQRVALSILRARYADLAGNPTGFAVAGDYSESGRDPKAVWALIGQLAALLGEAVPSGLPALQSAPIAARACHPAERWPL